VNQDEFRTNCFLGDAVCPRNARTGISLYLRESGAIQSRINGAFDPHLIVGNGFGVRARISVIMA
jgi:hypothetical protein